GEVGDGRVAAPRCATQRLHHVRILGGELRRAQAVADDLRAREELVAPAVIAVVVRVDDPARGPRPDPRVGRGQIARVRQVPEGVDDEPAAAVDETGVARAEPAILLQAGVHRGRHLDEIHDRPYRPPAAASQPGASTRNLGRSNHHGMKFALMYANAGPFAFPETLTHLPTTGERVGVEPIWAVEHVVIPVGYQPTYPYDPSGKIPAPEQMPLPDPLISLTYAAAVTKRLRLATGILILPQRHPLYVAKEVASLDVLSGGRVILGIGVGWLAE